MKNIKLFILVCLAAIVMTGAGYAIFEKLKEEISEREAKFYKGEVETIRNTLIAMIEEKEKATLALAITMQNNYDLIDAFESGNVSDERLKYIIKVLNEKTLYKSVWLQLIDSRGVSIYRSWTSKRGDSLIARDDIRKMLKSPEIKSGISVDSFAISFKAMVPIYDDKKRFLGIFEVITHFNSIDRQFHKKDIHSIVLADKQFKSRLKYGYTKKFIDDYYVANFNADPRWIDYLKKHGIENYLNIDDYIVEGDHIILSVPIKDVDQKIIGYYILIKPVPEIDDKSLSFFIFKIITATVFLLIFFTIFSILLLWRRSSQQKRYYKQIIDTSSNIILVIDKDGIVDANRRFFDYFSGYSSLDEFRRDYACISDLFVKEDALLQKYMDGKLWVEFLLDNPNKEFKVKILYKDNEWYFNAYANVVKNSTKELRYVVVLNDITILENQRKELEKASLTDPLTGIGNRRYFNIKLDNEIIRSKRYSLPLSIVMFDIDHFKFVNDNYGHDAGDEVLKEIVNIIGKSLRETDIFCRVGGEEFIIILPETPQNNAFNIAEKLRKIVESHSKEPLPNVAISLGVTQLLESDNKDSLLKRADDALYEAKDSGRNCSCIAKIDIADEMQDE